MQNQRSPPELPNSWRTGRDPSASIVAYRMDSNDPDVAMPEIGRTVIHDEGVALVSEWIASLSGPPCN